jgi:hypothetical protein
MDEFTEFLTEIGLLPPWTDDELELLAELMWQRRNQDGLYSEWG